MAARGSEPVVVAAPSWTPFENPQQLAEALAQSVGESLKEAIRGQGRATLAVSGGSTPALFFEQLSAQALPWDQVTIVLVDERWSANPVDRNETLVRGHLLMGGAAAACFIPSYEKNLDLHGGLVRLRERTLGSSVSTHTFDVTVLGMGTDGHTASLFPGAPGLAAALDPRNPESWVSVVPENAPHARLSLTLSAIARSERVILHLLGSEKRGVLEAALQLPSLQLLPVAHVAAACARLEVWWAPEQRSGEESGPSQG